MTGKRTLTIRPDSHLSNTECIASLTNVDVTSMIRVIGRSQTPWFSSNCGALLVVRLLD